MSCFYILEINSLSVVLFAIIFSYSEDCLFTLLIVTFIMQNLLNLILFSSVQFNRSVMSDSATPWTEACQASLSITDSWSLLKLISIESVMPSNHLIPWCPFLLLPSNFHNISVFSNESVLRISGQSIGVSALASVLSVNILDWFPFCLGVKFSSIELHELLLYFGEI